jgi:hypothetical protein
MLMGSSAEGVKQHGTHNALTTHTGSQDAPFPQLGLDAIIVPASRPAEHLDHAVTLARAADCWLVILCSKHLRGVDARKFLRARSFHKAIVIDLPPGYRHKLLEFPGLQSLEDELPDPCGSYVTDLSMKRNVGLLLARMLRWHYVFFMDDDIRDIAYPDLRSTVNMLGSFSAAGMWVTDFPDNSIVCHANRMTGGSQDVFVSGAALAVDCTADLGFFPDIYNEDWLFFFDDASTEKLANSCLKATQLCYYPFAKAQRAAWQEFGDVIAEGLYALLHLDMQVENATREYWTRFLEARRTFLEAIMTRTQNVHPLLRDEMSISVQSALKSLLMIKPDLCERYIKVWRQDLASWKHNLAILPEFSIEEALNELRLVPPALPNGAGNNPSRWTRAVPNITAGPVTIPRSDTLNSLADYTSRQDAVKFVEFDEQYAQAMLAARENSTYSLWPISEAAIQPADDRAGRDSFEPYRECVHDGTVQSIASPESEPSKPVDRGSGELVSTP